MASLGVALNDAGRLAAWLQEHNRSGWHHHLAASGWIASDRFDTRTGAEEIRRTVVTHQEVKGDG